MKKALIIQGGWEGHEPAPTAERFARALRAEGFEVTVADTLEVLDDGESLKAYDLIVPNWTMGQLSGPQEANLCAAVQAGTGLAGFHGGMGDAFRGATSYQFMTGGQFVAHPDNIRDYTVQIVKRDDPITEGLSDFAVHSEQYYLHVDPSNEVLATTVFETESAPWVNGTVMPVAWKRHHGAGRVAYSALGHADAEFEQPEVFQLALRGMLWAAR